MVPCEVSRHIVAQLRTQQKSAGLLGRGLSSGVQSPLPGLGTVRKERSPKETAGFSIFHWNRALEITFSRGLQIPLRVWLQHV